MTQNEQHIGDKIKARRIELGLRSEDLAAKTGLGMSTLYRIERTGDGHMKTFRLIAAALDCQVRDLEVEHVTPAKPSHPRSRR